MTAPMTAAENLGSRVDDPAWVCDRLGDLLAAAPADALRWIAVAARAPTADFATAVLLVAAGHSLPRAVLRAAVLASGPAAIAPALVAAMDSLPAPVPAPSAAFAAFVASLQEPFSGARGSTGFDAQPVQALDAADRDVAVAWVTARLAEGADDPRLVETLAEIDSAAARAVLRQTLHHPSLYARLVAAVRLWRMHADPNAIAVFEAAARAGPGPTLQLTGLQHLEALPRPVHDATVIEAALHALDAEDAVVRTAGLSLLYRRVGLDGLDNRIGSAVWSVRLRLASTCPPVQRHARQQLDAWLAALRGGATPADLGLIPPPSASPAICALRDAVVYDKRWSDAHIDAVVAHGVPGERAYAVDMLTRQLELDKPAAALALGRLGGPVARIALHAAAERTQSPALANACAMGLMLLGDVDDLADIR